MNVWEIEYLDNFFYVALNESIHVQLSTEVVTSTVIAGLKNDGAYYVNVFQQDIAPSPPHLYLFARENLVTKFPSCLIELH